jgi:pimeloyl-ACP methyl ester carboxylesterase
MLKTLLILMGMMYACGISASAQGDLPEPQRIEVAAEDGLNLIGDYYTALDTAGERPALLLLHGMGGTRHNWEPLIGSLLDHGYHVLTVDQRAWGETGGARDMVAAIGDIAVWFDWLRTQRGVDGNRLATIGASWGTVPALAGCAADTGCVTTILVSPGDFPLLNEALFETLSERSVLFVVGRSDVLRAARMLFDRTAGEAALYTYNTGLHGTAFFAPRSSYQGRATRLVLGWLDEHFEA